jgi:GGDEF domain-containing protein
VEARPTERRWQAARAAAHLVTTGALLLALGLLAGQDVPRVALVAAVATLLTAAGAAAVDGLVGIVIGLVGAVAVTAAHRTWGGWELVDVIQVVLLVALGWSAGVTGAFARRTARHLATPPHGAVSPSLHSLGLLDAASARLRIDEELRRRRGTDRPLTVVLVRVEQRGGSVDEQVRRAVTKAVARAVESSTRDTDVPFALTDDVLGVILPDTDEGHAWRLLGALVQDTLETSFAHRADGQRVPLREAVALHSVLVAADESTTSAEQILGPGRARAESLAVVDAA